MKSTDPRVTAQPETLVDRLPKTVTTENVHLAHAEIERRRNELAWGHGGRSNLLAGQMALAQAYERIARLESQTDDYERLIRENAELGELVRAAQHHIPRAWPQWTDWAADAWRTLGPDFAVRGSGDYCPPKSEREGGGS